jgi:putative endopeptidase
MDDAAIEKLGLRPLQPTLERIGAIADRKALAQALGSSLRADLDVLNATKLHTDRLFGLWVAQDLDNPARYIPFVLQGGLGLPDRSYYLESSARMATIRDKYQAHIALVLTLAKIPDADAKAARIFALEHHIAAVHWSRVDSEDVLKANNHWLPVLIGKCISRQRTSRASPNSPSGSRAPSLESQHSLQVSRLKRGRTI